jgi:hypothetical protein
MYIGQYDLVHEPGYIYNESDDLYPVLAAELFTLKQEIARYVGYNEAGNCTEGEMPGIEYAGPYYPA